ncbi:hypothetical protein OCA5_pOC16700040 (plasmid) [Afipia carboxidovorans OM5]|uniref:Uncharacterized protein n=1 Tax=Afipia carboxidovorans (strain ATCC 49405 / DSM 1227 / KCTC 32145 / OM5) TaxID=504832 RepID=F8C188_AFIC5|nr:hypothetical protein OCA4_pOC167B00040 [Afipia carboxidovorans OM4]AEI08203.1 hypothetical protein OCA5_pOC16700040 [Afipia carboxidovorans OM5]
MGSPCVFLAPTKSRVRAAIADLSPSGLLLSVTWLDSYGRRRHVGPWSQEFSPAGFPCKRDPDRHSSRMRLRRQNSWLQPGRSAALALRSPLACSGSVSSSRP